MTTATLAQQSGERGAAVARAAPVVRNGVVSLPVRAYRPTSARIDGASRPASAMHAGAARAASLASNVSYGAGTEERLAALGMSAKRLGRIGEVIEHEIELGRLPGAVVVVARRGQVVYQGAWGYQDPVAKQAMRFDSIFRSYAFGKPLVAVAAMLLVEDGVMELNDPIAKFLPAFAEMKVSTPEGLVPANRKITVHDLLRHTAGLTYGEITKNEVVKAALKKAELYQPGKLKLPFEDRGMSPADMVERLAAIPLVTQPGTTWEYSLASDLLGRVVEAATGKRLYAFMKERLFVPLGMPDTGFFVPWPDHDRLAQPFPQINLLDVTTQPANDSAGSGLVTTAVDYLRFGQMLLNGGVLDGKRVMSPSTIRLMTSDHLGDRFAFSPKDPGQLLVGSDGYTFGLGFAVRKQDGIASIPGSAGEFMWGSFGGSFFWVDPREQITAVYMTQAPKPDRAYYRRLIKQLVYQAIDE